MNGQTQRVRLREVRSMITMLLPVYSVTFVMACFPSSGDPPKRWKAGPLPETKAIGTTAVTMKVAGDDAFNTHLKSLVTDPKSDQSLRVVLKGMGTTDAKAGIKVFLNSPNTDPTPGGESIHLVGVISSYGKAEKEDYALDLAPVIRRLVDKKKWQADDSITLRMVYAPLSSKHTIGDATVLIEEVVVEAGKPQKK
jgi:hypothetical protein